MVSVPVLVADVWKELLICVAGVLFGALFATVFPRVTSNQQEGWTPLGWKRLALTAYGALIVRETWRAMTAVYRSWNAQQSAKPPSVQVAFKVDPVEPAATGAITPIASSDKWYVDERDLEFFQYHCEQNGHTPGATQWEQMMEKNIPNFIHYTAWRRILPDGKAEYKSVTLCPDATAQEFNDLYFDDDFRVNWDGMVIHHEVLEHGDFAARQQVVRWIRRFPFAFLSDREYSIARRSYRIGDTFYGLTKAVDHPRAPPNGKVVHMDVFRSMWSSRDVPCPWGSDKPACETTLLHHEQFKIPENLARFAVKAGMWGFVKKLAEEVPKFVATRRGRAGSHEVDPGAYGAGCSPNPPLRRRLGADSTCSLSTLVASGRASLMLREEDSDEGTSAAGVRSTVTSERGDPLSRQPSSIKAYVPRESSGGKVKAVLAMALMGGALLLAKSRGAGGVGLAKGRKVAARRHVSHRGKRYILVTDEGSDSG